MPSLSPGLFSCVVPQMCCKDRILCAAQPVQPRLPRDDVACGGNIPVSQSSATREHDGVGRRPPAPVPSQNSGVVC